MSTSTDEKSCLCLIVKIFNLHSASDEKSCLCLIVKIFNLHSAFFIFPSFPGWAPKFHNQNAHVFRVLGIQKLRIVKKGTRHIYRSFMNLYLAYNSDLHHDMLLFKQITRAILLSIFQLSQSSSLFHLLRSTLLMRRTNLCTRCLIWKTKCMQVRLFNTLTLGRFMAEVVSDRRLLRGTLTIADLSGSTWLLSGNSTIWVESISPAPVWSFWLKLSNHQYVRTISLFDGSWFCCGDWLSDIHFWAASASAVSTSQTKS